MIRKLLLAASIALCLALTILWIRSLHVCDQLTLVTHADTQYILATHRHGLNLTVTTRVHSHPPTWNPIFSDGRPHEGWDYSTHPWNVPVSNAEPVPQAQPNDGNKPVTPPGSASIANEPVTPGSAVIANEVVATGSGSVTIYAWTPPEPSFLGLGLESNVQSWTTLNGLPVTQRSILVAAPLWFVVALLAIPSAWTIVRIATRRRRIRSNRCLACGYDLRASPGKCPECGAPADARPIATQP